MMPFSTEQFLQVFEDYNRAVFPFQAALVLAAIVIVVLAVRRPSAPSKFVSLLLAFLWLWMGVAYHLLFFSEINPAAFLFAALFVLQASLFFYEGVVRNRLGFRAERNLYGVVGLLFVLYALIVYPILGYARGATYTSMPTFGLPCPTTIFTFGILLWTVKRVSLLLLIIPFLWSLIGAIAGISFGITEDFGLPAAGFITVAMLLYRERLTNQPSEDFRGEGNMNIADKNEYERLPLLAHTFLAGVPLKSLYKLDLPGGRIGMNVLDIKEAVGFNTEKLETGLFTRALFGLRGLMGRIFGWDDADELAKSVSFLPRLTAEERARSLVRPGKKEGISRVLYCFDNEFLAEIVNKTVHCFWVMATERTANGYALYMAVYVRKLNWFTPIYMALVTPMLKRIIYPAMNKSVKGNWEKTQQPNVGRLLAH